MSFLYYSFALNQKYRVGNFFGPIAAKSGRKYPPPPPPAQTDQKSLSQPKINNKKLHSVEEKSLFMQYHSMNIEKLPKRNKK